MKTIVRRLALPSWLIMLVAGFLASSTLGQEAKPKTTAPATPTIVFVCEHGAAKSVIAAAYFDKFAKQRGLKYKAVFRGTNPDPAVSPVTIKGLKEDGIEVPATAKPTLITQSDMDTAAQIVTLGCSVPNNGPNSEKVAAKLTNWSEIPSPSDYPLARDAISKRVQSLVEDLVKEDSNPKKSKKTVH
jgi:arsenate reductase (thioredoxin)